MTDDLHGARGIGLAIALSIPLWLGLCFAVFGQERPSTEGSLKAVSQKLLFELNEDVSCNAAKVDLEAKLAKANDELKHLRVDANGNPKEK